MSKYRQYSIVIHNVSQEKVYDIIESYVQKAKEYTMSVEPNPQGDGKHLHLFIQFKNQRSFKSVLRELQQLSLRIQEPKPPGEERDWGRVQLDIMKGNFAQATAYLKGETKDKPVGEVKSEKKILIPGEQIQRMLCCYYKLFIEGETELYPNVCFEYDDRDDLLQLYHGRFSEWCYEKWGHEYEK